jgi:hypothetical protein
MRLSSGNNAGKEPREQTLRASVRQFSRCRVRSRECTAKPLLFPQFWCSATPPSPAWSARWYVAPALIFVVLGILLGSSCLGWIEAGSDAQGFAVLSELALTVILFNQASTLNLQNAFRRGHLPMRLMAIGIPATFVLNTAIAVSVLPVLSFARS